MIKTLYDPVVEEEGRKKGIKKGEIEGIKKVALAALKEGLSLDMINKITGLDKKTLLKLKENNLNQ